MRVVIAFTLIFLAAIIVQGQNLAQETPDPLLPEMVTSLAWSPDGSRIAIGAGSGKCWQSGDKYSIRMISPSNPINAIEEWSYHNCTVIDMAWNSDNTKLISAGSYEGSTVWDTLTGKPILNHSASMPGPLQNRWKPNSTLIASIDMSDTHIAIWDSETSGDMELIKSGRVNSISWHPDGTSLASAGDDGITVWDSADWQSSKLVNQPVKGIVWSPDGKKIAGIVEEAMWVRVWDASTGEELSTFQLHTETINQIVWRFDSQMIASASDDKTVRVWDVVSDEPAEQFDYNGAVYAVDWSPDGSQLVFGGFQEDDPTAKVEIVSVRANSPTTTH